MSIGRYQRDQGHAYPGDRFSEERRDHRPVHQPYRRRRSDLEQSEVGISSLMDTWLLVRMLETGGERNRLLYVLKSRGMAHSNQMREFRLSDRGIELLDVYVGPGEVLTGSARLVQESRDRLQVPGRSAGCRAEAERAAGGADGTGGPDRGASGTAGRSPRKNSGSSAGRTGTVRTDQHRDGRILKHHAGRTEAPSGQGDIHEEDGEEHRSG